MDGRLEETVAHPSGHTRHSVQLSGEDQKFDLNSLVGVLREGAEGGDVLPVGEDNDGMDEQEYWRIHPRI